MSGTCDRRRAGVSGWRPRAPTLRLTEALKIPRPPEATMTPRRFPPPWSVDSPASQDFVGAVGEAIADLAHLTPTLTLRHLGFPQQLHSRFCALTGRVVICGCPRLW